MPPASAHPVAYTRLQKALHWAVVVVLAAQYLIFDSMGRPYHETVDTGVLQWTVISVGHAALGVSVLAMALLRLVLRVTHGAPNPPAAEPPLLQLLAKVTHWAIYALLVLLPVSGLIAWLAQVREVAEIHEVMTNIMLALIGLHLAGVVVHQVWWKTNLLSRMT